jgi:hypothetical protein
MYARLSLFTMSQETLKPKQLWIDVETHQILIEALAVVNVKRANMRIPPLKLGEYVNRILRAYHKENSTSERVA